jgi:metal-sulfur cluster biosynthetic enzyme
MTQPSAAVPDWVIRAVSTVFGPCCRDKGISVVDMGLLRSVAVHDGHARIELLLTSGWCPFAARVVADVETAICRQAGVEICEVVIVWDEVWTPDRLSPSAVRRLGFLPDAVAVPDRDAFVSAHRS